jgi:hypothetical protein
MRRRFFALGLVIISLSVGANYGGANGSVNEQAVIVNFDYGSSDWKPFFEFEKSLEQAISKSGTGEYDGNQLAVDGGDGSMYMYGPDADKLFAAVKPVLLSTHLLKNVRVTLRYGAVTDRRARIVTLHLGSYQSVGATSSAFD